MATKATTEPKKTAEILLYGVIDEFWGVGSAWFAQQMAMAEADGAEEIVVRINSAGGSAFEGIAIYNLLANASIPTRAVVDSLAASAASIVLQGADVREMRRGSFVMVHNPWGIVLGDARDMRKGADDLDALAGGLADIYAESTGKSLSEIREIMDAETWYSGSDAVDSGFADEVLKKSRAKVALRNQAMIMKGYRNIPEAVATMAGIRAASAGDPETQTIPADPPADDTETEDEPTEDDAPPAPAPEPQPTPPAPAAPTEPAPPAPAEEETIPAAYAREVASICARAGIADRIDGYLDSRTPIATVKDDALAALCKAQDATHVDGRKPAKVAGADPYGWAARLKAAGAFVN